MIVRDEKLLAAFRSQTRCEHCRRYVREGCHPHHFTARGMGGGGRLDVRCNLLSLCWQCHRDVHDGRIPRKELLEIIAHREQLSPEEVMDQLWRLRRQA